MFIWKFHFEGEREGMIFFFLIDYFRTKQKKKKKSIPNSHAYIPEVSVYAFFLFINMTIPCGSDKAIFPFSIAVV